MRRGFALYLLLALTATVSGNSGTYRCDGAPEGKHAPRTPSDDRFHIVIQGNPNTYIPGTKYSVSLRADSGQNSADKFSAFALTVEPSKGFFPNEAAPDVGTFSLYGDTLTTFSAKCPNTVIQANNIPKSEITVLWIAPPSNTGCVVFRATVVESRDLWYMHDGSLSRTLCEDVQDNLDEQPEVLERCCACDEAKYEVTFEGLWSRHTHPKDFPTNGWLTKFSDVIGASHTGNYRFWDYEGKASEGLKDVAERGLTNLLEGELKANSQFIRTIIKARGISYPNITGKTFAVFRVDRNHHLMSLVSKIDPSPDWIVGVSGLELCLSNCSWLEFKVLNLKPWDAGTDNGTTYIAPSEPTIPPDRIRRISSRYPDDERNPFYDPTGEEMKPLARLYLTRQRIYEKTLCNDDYSMPEDDDSTDCAVSKWGKWSPCDNPCGPGWKRRQRFYLNVTKAKLMGCAKELSNKSTCTGRQCHRHPGAQFRDPNLDSPECQVSEWGEFSSCTATCGRAHRTRIRKYLSRNGMKRCGHLHGAPELQQTIPCQLDPCEGEVTEDGGTLEMCETTGWSEWTPCSASCGRGRQMRTRLPLDPNHFNGQANPCGNMKSVEEVDCNGTIPSCDVLPHEAREVCRMPFDRGPCQAIFERWYFDEEFGSCRNFTYSGCQGNRNNFVTKEDCLNGCSSLIQELKINGTAKLLKYGVRISAASAYQIAITPPDPSCGPNTLATSESTNFGRLKSASQLKDDTTMPTIEGSDGDKDLKTVDCKFTRFSKWSPCSVTCGVGFHTKTRHVRIHARNGGQPCIGDLKKTKKCRMPIKCENQPDEALPQDYISYEDSGEKNALWGETSLPPRGFPGQEKVSKGDCVLDNWSAWSPCSATCGLNASRQRTRNILAYPTPFGRPCGPRVDTMLCNFLPCKN